MPEQLFGGGGKTGGFIGTFESLSDDAGGGGGFIGGDVPVHSTISVF